MKYSLLALSLIVGGAFANGALANAALVNSAPVLEAGSQTISAGSNYQQSGDRVERLERIIQAKQQADFESQNRLSQLQQEVQELRGIVEQQTYQIEQMLTRQRQLYDEIAQLSTNAQNAAMQTGGAGVGMAPTQSLPNAAMPTTPSLPMINTAAQSGSLSETAAYEQAVNLVLKERKYEQAIPAFEGFIKQYPNSSFAPNANYWLGQLLYNKQEFDAAKTAFVRVTEFQDSAKRADSLVKLGLIAEKQQDATKAKDYYQQVLDGYADSSAARLAQQHLAGLAQN